MKSINLNTFIKTGLILTLFSGLIFSSCKVKNPMDGFLITIKPDAVSAPNSFSFVDAKTGFTKTPLEGVEVKITGPGASVLYTSDGLQTFKIVNGQIGLCVRKGANPSMINPIKFDLVFDAPGYLKKTVSEQITSMNPVNREVRVLNLEDLPKTASKKDTTFAVPSTGTTTPIVIATPATDSIPSLNITLPTGTKFVDANNNVFTGSISTTVLTSVSDGEDLGAYPMGLFSTNIVDEFGNKAPVDGFVPVSTVSAQFSGGGKALQTIWADNNTRINPYNLQMQKRIVIGKSGFMVLKTDSADIPANSSMSSGGIVINLQDANIKVTGATEGYSFTIYYKYKIFKNAVLFRTVVSTKSMSALDLKNGVDIDLIGNETQVINANTTVIAESKLLINKVGSPQRSEIINAGNNVYALPNQGPVLFNAKFSVYCTDQKAYAVLPAGWPVYLIKREDYFNTLVNGHRVQPSDDPNLSYFIKVEASAPVTENNTTYNLVRIPVAALVGNKEYIVCTYFGSKGLIFNDFNNTSGKMITPVGIEAVTQDYEFLAPKMDVACGQ